MKIKAKEAFAGYGVIVASGEVVDLPEAAAAAAIRAGSAEAVEEDKPEPVKATKKTTKKKV